MIDAPQYPLLIIGTVKGATHSAARYFGLHHESLEVAEIHKKKGLCTGLAFYEEKENLWRCSMTGKIIGRFTVTLALQRAFENHVDSLFRHRHILQESYKEARSIYIPRLPSKTVIKSFLLRRNKEICEIADKVLTADVDIPLRSNVSVK